MLVRKALVGIILVFLVMFVFSMGNSMLGGPVKVFADARLQTTPEPAPRGVDEAIQAAFQAKLDKNRTAILGFAIFDVVIDHIQYAADGSTALVWLALRDRETGEVIASEPGLSIASNPTQGPASSAASWSILMQNEATFNTQLGALPDDLLTEEIRERFLDGSQPGETINTAAAALGGYKLPWTAGLSKRMTNSIGHVYSVSGGLTSCPTTCRYAFDFADGTMFPLLAAKGGTVKAYKTTCPNFGESCTNYLVLEDQSTIPTTYQLYYHMAKESVPSRLRTIGAVVKRGEYIGDADDTGFSTGHHLHFHVYTTATGTNWSWGPSIDVTFDDVSINGGRPRTCSEAKEYSNMGSQCQSTYTSGNTPANPPKGSLSMPTNHQFVRSSTVKVSGSASDDIQIMRIQVLVNYDGTWKSIDDITPNGNGPYSKDVNLCSAGIPDGPFALTVRIYDREGSQAPGMPVRQLIKNFSCNGGIEPPATPACTPNENQVAMYADTDFRGACTKFDASTSQGYTSGLLGAVGDNTTSSIQVGSSVRAVLFDRSSDVTAARPNGRVETLQTSDAGLSDNLIGVDHISGLWVLPRSDLPDEAFINPIGNLPAGGTVTSQDSLVLSWEGGGGATEFNASLTGPGTPITKTLTGNTLSIGSLPTGSYQFNVTAKNAAGSNTSKKTFTVTAATLASASSRSVPYNESVESGTGDWIASGLWRRGSIDVGGRGATQAWIYNNGTDYTDATYRAGDLTSPPIVIPAGGPYYLRFAYYMDTEDGTPNWDQRWVQVSESGGSFKNLVQLTDDKEDGGQVWLNNGPINLSAYAGKTIRVRFHFDTIDEDRNAGKGWVIDDVSITATGANTSCGDNNNTPATAQAVSIGDQVSALICPEGDLDYYKITATAGQPVTVDIDARTLSPASRLDSLVQLIESDQRSVILENDDEEYAKKVDSLFTYVVQRTGTYFIKVKAWNYPSAAGTDYPYILKLRQDVPVPPQSVNIDYPTSNMAPSTPFTISASAVDFDGGPVAQVDFFWHGPDWSKPWVNLGSDVDGGDGWSTSVTPSTYGNVKGSALYVQAVSRTGGVSGAAIWDFQLDQSMPSSQLSALPAQWNSTAIPLEWSASDDQNDIDHFDLQFQLNGGSWQTNPGVLAGSKRNTWFIGTPGSTYKFRLRAVDRANNQEPYPANAEATITLAAACTPDAKDTGQDPDFAVDITLGAASPTFNLCRTQQAGSDDVDWYRFTASAGQKLLFMAAPQGGGAKLIISLYDENSNYYGSWTSADFETTIPVRWTAPKSTTYYVEVKPAQTGLFGTDMIYKLWIGEGSWLNLPLITH